MNFKQWTTNTARIGQNATCSMSGHKINEIVAALFGCIHDNEKKEVQSEGKYIEEMDDRLIIEGLTNNLAEKGDVRGGVLIANNVFERKYVERDEDGDEYYEEDGEGEYDGGGSAEK